MSLDIKRVFSERKSSPLLDARMAQEDALIAQEGATHVFGSLYNFSIAATDEIIQSFSARAAPNVRCEFYDGCYIIHCPRSDNTSLFQFINFIKRFIEMEVDKAPEIFEDFKVTRKKGTISVPISQMDDLARLTMQPLKVINEHPSIADSKGLLIEHETVKQTWAPDQSGKEVGSRLSDDVIQQIGSLCFCRIDWADEMVSELEVKGDNEGDVRRAISKLGVMDKVAINQMSFPRIFSFPVVEGELSFMLEMRALRYTGDRRCQTTLLPPNSPIIKSIRNALVISIIKNGCRVLIHQKRLKESSKGPVSPCIPPPFKSFGADRDQALIPSTKNDAMLKVDFLTPTTAWVSDVATTPELVQPFLPDSVVGRELGEISTPNTTTVVTYKPPFEPISIQKVATKRVRVVKRHGKNPFSNAEPMADKLLNDTVQATVTTTPASACDSSNENDVRKQSVDLPLRRTSLTRVDQAISVQDLPKVAVYQEALPIVNSLAMPPTILAAMTSPEYRTSDNMDQALVMVAEHSTKALSLRVGLDQENQAQAVHRFFEHVPPQTGPLETKPLKRSLGRCETPKPLLRTVAGTAFQPTTSSTSFLQHDPSKDHQPALVQDRPVFQSQAALPEITPPYMPPSPPLVPKPTIFGWEGRPVVRGRAGPLIDMTMLQEHQDSAKFEPQNPKRTMGQKAPSRGLIGGNTARIQKVEEVSRQLLALALPRQGPVTFELGIGRLLINHETGSQDFKARSFSLSEWSSAFAEKPDADTHRFETVFTPRLTTSLVDMESILDIRLSQGRRIFNPEPVLRNVTYVYKCTTKHGDQVTINLDEDGTFEILGPEVLIGSLDFHFPKRVWDARLRLTTNGMYSKRIQQQVDAIINNLKIFVSQGGTNLDLSTRTINQELVIDSITVRRKTTYSSKVYADLLLHLCEVQDLYVSRNENEYHGTIKESNEMIDVGRLWWEASVTSISAAEILGINSTLELGEVAKWSPHTITDRGVVRDLYSLAHEIVTNIDNVGYMNKGVKGGSGSKGQTASYQISHQRRSKPVEPGSYW